MRYYTIKGSRYPSVTTILSALAKPGLVQWAANCTRDALKEELFGFREASTFDSSEGKRILDQCAYRHKEISRAAMERGTDVHKRIERYVQAELKGANQHDLWDDDPFVAAFRTWESERRFTPIASEMVIYSLQHSYAGTCDLVGTVPTSGTNELMLLDVKTGSKTYPEYRLQLAAYAYAYGEMTGRFPERCAVLHILDPEDNTPTVRETEGFTASELFLLFEVFLALKRVFMWLSHSGQNNNKNTASMQAVV